MKKYQIDAMLKKRGMLHAIAKKIGIAFQDLPSKYLIYGQNVSTLVTKDPQFHVVYTPTDLDRIKWIDDLADLIRNDAGYKNIIVGDIKDYALQVIGYKFLNIPQEYPFMHQQPVRKALPGEPADANGAAIPNPKFVIRFHCMIVKINNMGQ